ncbi:M16 family metallopeptidase [Catellatospora sichuanensis]|uniref:M16 family metallopeptidase n=1 Tax=Catellatospora sichuanensis TaxID=1969805 RepID=UPI001182A2A7|nr:insulinase family protein [Catellatospora sichuanensis]
MLELTEVDGVPTLVAPSSGQAAAGLIFRVGQADETLPTHGITHLVEHLALHDSGLSDYHYNGETASVYTHFHLRGSESDVVGYLGKVCAGLADLPMHRLETEKEILRTESRSRGATSALPLRRYGARGYGLPSYPEWGLARLGPDDLRQWVEDYFTRENAVLWIAGNGIPAGLRLPLRPGVRRAAPLPTSALPATPAWFSGDDTSVVFSAVVRRSTAASVYSGVLERELFRDLRQEGGYSYTATSSYDPRGDGCATVTAHADALPGKQDAVLGGFVDVLARMRYGNIDPSSVAGVRTKSLEKLNHPEIEAARLPGHALNLLTGQRNLTVDELRAELSAVTAEQVHAVAAEAVDAGLLQAPHRTTADWAGFTAAPPSSAHEVDGRRHPHREDAAVELVIGPEATSIVRPGSCATVRYDACAAMMTWPDGARRLIGDDGVVLHLEPTMWAVPPPDPAALDAAVEPARHIPMPARDPATIPRPGGRRVDAGGANAGEIIAMVLLTLVAVGLGTFSVLLAVIAATTGGKPLDLSLLGGAAVGTALFATPVVLLLRRRRRR